MTPLHSNLAGSNDPHSPRERIRSLRMAYESSLMGPVVRAELGGHVLAAAPAQNWKMLRHSPLKACRKLSNGLAFIPPTF